MIEYSKSTKIKGDKYIMAKLTIIPDKAEIKKDLTAIFAEVLEYFD